MPVLRAFYLGILAALIAAAVAAPASSGWRAPGPHPLLHQATLEASAAAVARYRAIVAAGGWPTMPAGPALRLGATGGQVALLRARLRLSGDLGPAADNEEVFDAAVEGAVRRFQWRHGLIDSGIVYGSTRRVLNVPATARLAQLEADLATLRALVADAPGGRHVTVDVASFELEAVADDRVELRSRVIVGTPATPTPLISATIFSMSFLPPWNAPASVAARDILPVARTDPAALSERNIHVFDSMDRAGPRLDPARVDFDRAEGLWFRQEPGPFNPLGVVRFNLPNEHDILLHDTPDKALFRRDRRALTAGCVRVEEALALAAWLLRGRDGWDRVRIDRVVANGKTRGAMLAQPVAVHFIYLTAWTAADGVTRFRDDIYGINTTAGDTGRLQSRLER